MLGIWIAVIVVAVIIEIITQVQLVTIWAALGGIAALVCDVFGVSSNVQIIVFFAVTFAALALTRPFVRKLTKNIRNTPTNADMNIGRTGLVTKIVDEGTGIFRVNVAGADWSARTADSRLPQIGQSVRVEAIEGVKLVVSPV